MPRRKRLWAQYTLVMDITSERSSQVDEEIKTKSVGLFVGEGTRRTTPTLSTQERAHSTVEARCSAWFSKCATTTTTNPFARLHKEFGARKAEDKTRCKNRRLHNRPPHPRRLKKVPPRDDDEDSNNNNNWTMRRDNKWFIHSVLERREQQQHERDVGCEEKIAGGLGHHSRCSMEPSL